MRFHRFLRFTTIFFSSIRACINFRLDTSPTRGRTLIKLIFSSPMCLNNNKKRNCPNCLNNCPLPFAKKISLFSRGGIIINNFHEFSLFWLYTFPNVLEWAKTIFLITYYWPLVYFEVFSIYLSVFHEFMWSLQQSPPPKEGRFGPKFPDPRALPMRGDFWNFPIGN